MADAYITGQPGMEGILGARGLFSNGLGDLLNEVASDVKLGKYKDDGKAPSVPTDPTGTSLGSTPDTATGTQVANARSELGSTYDDATKRADQIRTEVAGVPGEELNPNQNINPAEQSRFGTLNKKTPEETMQYSREVDAYNAMPTVTNVREGVRGGGVQFVDKGLNKPQLETEESRLMRTSERLDERQRQLEQDLQHLVNRTDYDAFVKWYEQKLNMNLTLMQQEQAVITFNRMQHISNLIQKDFTWYRDYLLKFKIAKEAADYITKMAGENRYIYTSLFMTVLGLGIKPPTLEDKWDEDLQRDAAELYKRGETPDSIKNKTSGGKWLK